MKAPPKRPPPPPRRPGPDVALLFGAAGKGTQANDLRRASQPRTPLWRRVLAALGLLSLSASAAGAAAASPAVEVQDGGAAAAPPPHALDLSEVPFVTRRAVWCLLSLCLAVAACAAPPGAPDPAPRPAPAPAPAPDLGAPPAPSPAPPGKEVAPEVPAPVAPVSVAPVSPAPVPPAPVSKPAAPPKQEASAATPPPAASVAPSAPPAPACADALGAMTRLLRPADRQAMVAAEQAAWRGAVAAGYRAVAACRGTDLEGLALFRRGTALFLARDYGRAEQDIRRSAGLPGPHNTDGYAASFAKLLRACGEGARFAQQMETYRQAVVLETAGFVDEAKGLYATLPYSGCPDLAWRGRYSELRMEYAR